MCGLNAIFAYRGGGIVDRGELIATRDAMTARGPDGAGLYWSEVIGMGHRRLAIIDLSEAGAQPMALGEAGDQAGLRIVFNGEIYNYRELRAELEAQGAVFRSHSDTEVLLHLYRRDGRAMTRRLRGMYAFALWDEQRQGLFLARDPFGIKPLYYADDGSSFRCASQVKALLAGGRIDTAPEPAGHAGFFLWGCVPEPYTLYRGIRAVPAGCHMWIDQAGASVPEHFFDLATECASVQPGPADPREALVDSVRAHLIADVPVGVFLSSGLDSATLMALAAEQTEGDRLRTITLGFDEFRGGPNDETPLAETIAAAYGANHTTRRITSADFAAERERLLAAMDQPSIDGVNVYFVAKAARESGLKVALSGLGGDELFGGYNTFAQVPKLVRGLAPLRMLPGLGKGFRLLAGPLLSRFASPKAAGLLELGPSLGGAYLLRRGLFMPWELPSLLGPDMARQGWQDLQPLVRLEEAAANIPGDRLRIAALEMAFYMRNQLLRDADWAGMAHSLEIRVPLVDIDLFRRLLPAQASATPPGKRDMALTPRQRLPEAVLDRPKTGFFVPVQQWLQGGAAPGERGLRFWARAVHGQVLAQHQRHERTT